MPTTKFPEVKEAAAEISRHIENARPLKRKKGAPEDEVTGGFNQNSGGDVARHSPLKGTNDATGDAAKGHQK